MTHDDETLFAGGLPQDLGSCALMPAAIAMLASLQMGNAGAISETMRRCCAPDLYPLRSVGAQSE